MGDAWTVMHQCVPQPRDVAAEHAADHAWLTFFVECETYDQTVCTGCFNANGERMPASPEEHRAIVEYAQTRMQVTRGVLRRANVDSDLSERARLWASRLTFEQAKAALAHLNELSSKETT